MNIFPYLIGSILTVACFFIFNKIISKEENKKAFVYTQSLSFNAIRPFVSIKEEIKKIKTQSAEFERKQYVPVVLSDNQAYWILNNTLFVADQVGGMIDKDTTRPVDTMAMNKVQLDKTIFIVEALTAERTEHDNRNSRN